MLTYTLFVVDDEETARNGIALALEKDFGVQGFADAEKALDALRTQSPDLILLDIGLPGMNGIDALQEIKRLRPATVVTIYQLGVVNQRLRPQLERQLRSSTRVVTLDFPMPGWQPLKVVHLESENGVANTLYEYVCPQSARGVANPGMR